MKISPRPFGVKKSSPHHKQLAYLQNKIAETADIQALKVVLEASTSEEVFQDEVDLVDWIPALNCIDAALERGIPRVSLVHVEEVKGLELELEYNCWVGILEACLRFTRLLLSNSTGRNIYNSVDRLEAMLFAREELLADEALGCMCALAVPPYPHRGGHDISPDLKIPAPWLSNVKGRADKLLLLMTGWGGLAQGVGMLDCIIKDTNTLPQYAGDLIFESENLKFAERALHRTGETSAEAFNRIVSTYKVPAECQFALLVNIRLAVGFGSFEMRRNIVERRLLALLTLSLADPMSPLLLRHYGSYPDFVQELIDLARVQFPPRQPVPYVFSSLAMRCLVPILSASGSHGGALRVVSRNSNIFCEIGMVRSQYGGLVLCLIRHSVTELMSPKDENRGPSYYEWMESVLSLVHAVVDGDHAEELVECSLLGALLSLLKKWQIFQSNWLSEHERSSTALPLRLLYGLIAHAIYIVEVISMNDSFSFNEFGDDGMGVLVSVLSAELEHLCRTPSFSSSLSSLSCGNERRSKNSNGGCSSSNGSLMEPSLAQRDFIHSVLRCLSKLVHRAQSTTQSNGSRVLQGMEMTNVLICLFDNMHICGGTFAAFAVVLVSDIMNHAPLYVSHVKSSGIAGSFIRSLKAGLPPCAPLIMSIPGMLCALCLVPDNAENSNAASSPFYFGPDTLHSFLSVFASPEFVLPSSRCHQVRVPSVVGSGLEEFMRHVPKLKVKCMSAIVAVMKQIVSTAPDQDQYLVHQYVMNLAKLLKPILSKSGNLRSFINENGLNVLSELFPISLLPPRSFLANLSCMGAPRVSNCSHEFQHAPGHFPAIRALGIVFNNLCTADPGRFLEHLCITLERTMEDISSCCTTLVGSDGDNLTDVLRCVSPDCLSVPLHAVAPNPSSGDDDGGGGGGTLSVYLESYVALLKKLVYVGWLSHWIKISLSFCNMERRRNLGIPFLNSSNGRRILSRFFNLQKSAVVELCRYKKKGSEKEECCCCPSIPVPSEMFIIRIVHLVGSVVHSGLSTDNSPEVCTLDMGTTVPAYERVMMDSGMARYRTSYGWVSDYNPGDHGGCRYPIFEVIDLRINNAEIEPSASSSGGSSDVLLLDTTTTTTTAAAAAAAATKKRYPVVTLREAGIFVLQSLVDGVTGVISILGKALVHTSSPSHIKSGMQDRIDLTQLVSDMLRGFLQLEVPPVQQPLFVKSIIKLVTAVLFDDHCRTVTFKVFWDLVTLNGNDEHQHGKMMILPTPGNAVPMDMVFSSCISDVFCEALKGVGVVVVAAASSHDESGREVNMMSDSNSNDGCSKVVQMKQQHQPTACVNLDAALTLLRCFCDYQLVGRHGLNIPASNSNTQSYLTIAKHYINVRLAETVFDLWSDPNLGLRPKEFLEPFLSCIHRIITSLCSTSKTQDSTLRTTSTMSGPPPSRHSLFHDSGTALNDPPEAESQRQPSEATLLAAMECGFTRDHILQGYQAIQSEQIEVLMDWLLSHPPTSSASEENATTTTSDPMDTTSCSNDKNQVAVENQSITTIIGQWQETSSEKCEAFLSSLPEVCIRLVGIGGPGINIERNSYVAGFVKEIFSLRGHSDTAAVSTKMDENQDINRLKDFIGDLVKISTDELLSLFSSCSLESCNSSSCVDKVANHLHLLLLAREENSKHYLQLRKLNLHTTLLRSVHETALQLQSGGGSDESSSWPSHIPVSLLLLDSMISFLVVDNDKPAVTVTTQSSLSDVNNDPEHPSDPLLSIIPMVTTLLPEDFAVELTAELGGILVQIHAGSIPPAPSGVMQAMLQLLRSLLKTSKCVASLWEKLGEKGVNVLLYMPASCSFKGHTSLVGLILHELLEDSVHCQTVMESIIRDKFALLSRLPTAGRGVRGGEAWESVRLSDLLNIVGSLIAQGRMAFVRALRSQLLLTQKDQPSNMIFVVLKQQPNTNKQEEGISSSSILKNALFPLTSCMLKKPRHVHCKNKMQEEVHDNDDHFISTVDAALLLSELMSFDPVCLTVMSKIYCSVNGGQKEGEIEIPEEARETLQSINHCIPGCTPPDPSVLSFILHKLLFLYLEDGSPHVPNNASEVKLLERMRVESMQAGVMLILNLIKGPADVCRHVCKELVKAICCQGLDHAKKLNGSNLVPLASWSELSLILMIVGEHLYLNKCQGHEEEEANPQHYLVNEGLFFALFNAFSRLDLEEKDTITPAATTTMLHSLQYVLLLHRWKVLEYHRRQKIKQEENSMAKAEVVPVNNSASSQTAARRRRGREDPARSITLAPGGVPFTIQVIDDSRGYSGVHDVQSDDVLETVLVNGGILSLDTRQGVYRMRAGSFADDDRMRIGRENVQEMIDEVGINIESDDENDEIYCVANFHGLDDILVNHGTSNDSAIPSLLRIVRNLVHDGRLRLRFDVDLSTTSGSGLRLHEDSQSPLRICNNLLGLTNLSNSGGRGGHTPSSISSEPNIHPLLQHTHHQHWQRGNGQRRRSREDLQLRIQALLGGSYVNETSPFSMGTQTSLIRTRGDSPVDDRTMHGCPSYYRHIVPFNLRNCGFNVTPSIEADVANQLEVRDVQPPSTAEPATTDGTGNQAGEVGGNENDGVSLSLPLYPARDTSPSPPYSQHSDDDSSSSACSCSLNTEEGAEVCSQCSCACSCNENEEEEHGSSSENDDEALGRANDPEMHERVVRNATTNVPHQPFTDRVNQLLSHMHESMSTESLNDFGDRNTAVDQQASATANSIEASGLDPEVLAALPLELQEEVLENEERKRREEEQVDISRAEEIDNASFVASLTPDLRREVLITADSEFLRTLPPNLVAEAILLRERGPQTMDEDEDSGSGEDIQIERTIDDLVGPGSGGERGFGGSATATNSMNLPLFWMKRSEEVPLTAAAWIMFVRFLYLRTPIKHLKDLLCLYEHLCEMHEQAMYTVVHSFTDLLAGDRMGILAATKKFLLTTRNGGGWDDSSSFSSDDDLKDEYEEGVIVHNNHSSGQQLLLPANHLIGPNGNGSPREDAESVVVQRVMKVLLHLIQTSPRVCHELLTAQMLPIRRKRKRAGNGEPSDSHPPLQILDYLLSQVERTVFSTSHRNMKQLLNMLGWLVNPLCEPQIDNHIKPSAQAQASVVDEEEEQQEAKTSSVSHPEPASGSDSSSSYVERVPIPRPIVSSECLHKLCRVPLLGVCDHVIVDHLRRILKSLCMVRENRTVLMEELVSIAAQLGRSLSKDLCKIASELHEVTTKSNSADTCFAYNLVDVQGSHVGVKFLCVLETLRWLIGPDAADDLLSSSNFGDVWSSLDQCLEALRPLEKSNMPEGDVAAHLLYHKKSTTSSSTSHCSSSMTDTSLKGLGTFGTIVAWGLLPTIEAFFVANKHAVMNGTSHLKVHDDIAENGNSSPGINISGLQLQQVKQCTIDEASATPKPPQNSLLTFVAANHTLINSLLHKNPRLMDLAFKPMASDPACRTYLDFGNKLVVFRSRMKTISQQSSCRVLHIDVPRDGVFEHSFHQTCVRSPNEMRGKLHVKFQGEEGVDAGGVTREWFSILAKEIFNENYALFIAASDGTTFQPNPLSGVNPEHLKYFKFVGRITGKAIADGELFPAPYTCSFYKHILGVPVTFADLEAIDPQFYGSLAKMLEENVSVEELGLDLTFVTEQNEFGRVEMVDLMPGGRNIPVTDKNKFDYVQRVAAHRMTSAIRPQIEAFLEGFHGNNRC